jgi:putative transposase
MPHMTANPIFLTDNQKRILEQFANGTHTPQHLMNRAKIVLLAAKGNSNYSIEQELNATNHTVIKWRNKYFAAADKLEKIEKETPLKIKETIINVLSDDERPGSPSKFTDEQVAAIIAISLQEPQTVGYPFSNWSYELLKIAVVEKGIVDSISNSQIRRFLKRKRS